MIAERRRLSFLLTFSPCSVMPGGSQACCLLALPIQAYATHHATRHMYAMCGAMLYAEDACEVSGRLQGWFDGSFRVKAGCVARAC